MDENTAITTFLAGSPFAVAGASNDRSKYGNRVLRSYWARGRQAFALNPNAAMIEGQRAYPGIAFLPETIHGLSLVTQPEVSLSIVQEALTRGVLHFWFQPGSEHPRAVELAQAAGGAVLAYGPCILVALSYRGE